MSMDGHEFFATLGGFWPAGDPGRCRQGSSVCRQAARDLAAIQAACQSTANSVQALNQGPPIDGFASWSARWESNPGYFPAAIRECNQLADALDAYARQVEESQHRLIELVVAALIALGVGVALTVFTAGLSDAAAAAIEAGLVAASFTECATLAAVAGDIVVAVGAGAIEGVVFDGALQRVAINVFHDQQGFNWSELGQSAALGGLTGGVGAGAGVGLRAGARLLPALAVTSPMVGRTLLALDRIPGTIRSGVTGTIAGGGFAAAFDQRTTGHVHPEDLVIGALSGGAGGAIGSRSRGARGGPKRGPSANLLARQTAITGDRVDEAPPRDWSDRANSISNIGAGANGQNALTLGSTRPGDAFSGVYDPATGTFSSYPSVADPAAPGAPPNAVTIIGGHGDINDGVFPTSRRTVAFTAFVESDGSISVGWRSSSVNDWNHGTRDAPAQYRDAIMQAIADATGRSVRSG
jgi:hypothetical protein